jgi:hypothetical protein
MNQNARKLTCAILFTSGQRSKMRFFIRQDIKWTESRYGTTKTNYVADFCTLSYSYISMLSPTQTPDTCTPFQLSIVPS